MDGKKILAVLQKPYTVTYSELDELELLNSAYPYSPLLHALIAKVKSVKDTPDANEALFAAAVNVPSRSILKRFMNDEISFNVAYSVSDDTVTGWSPPQFQAEDDSISSDQTAGLNANLSEDTAYSDSSIEDTTENSTEGVFESTDELNNLTHESRDNEQPFQDAAFNQDSQHKNASNNKKESLETSSEDDEMHKELEENLRALRDRRKILDEVLDEDEEKKKLNNPTNQFEEREKESVSKQSASFAHNTQEEQFRLIDKFVSSTPSFEFNPRELPHNDQQEDLTKKNNFSGLATENYAEIMVRQGKVEQAIEIYRKLIWKNPQKKTYFAQKIEALKKG